jgi:hypothetical protein
LTLQSVSNAGYPWRQVAADCRAWRILLCSVLAILSLPGARLLAAKQKAPATKTVSGVVTDKAANGMGGAEVTLKDKETGKSTAVYAESNGAYQFSDLDPHHDYEIQARFQGMTSETRQINSFDTRLKLVINLTLAPPGS